MQNNTTIFEGETHPPPPWHFWPDPPYPCDYPTVRVYIFQIYRRQKQGKLVPVNSFEIYDQNGTGQRVVEVWSSHLMSSVMFCSVL